MKDNVDPETEYEWEPTTDPACPQAHEPLFGRIPAAVWLIITVVVVPVLIPVLITLGLPLAPTASLLGLQILSLIGGMHAMRVRNQRSSS